MQEIDQLLVAAGAQRELLAEVEGFPIYAYEYHVPRASRCYYLSSGMHGDEPAGPLALKRLIQSGVLESGDSWLICPVINPTGLAAGTRENFQGIDINRDYLKQSSVEARAHASWLCGKNIDVMFSLHEDWESTGFYFYEINQAGDMPERYQQICAAVEKVMEMEPELEIDEHPVREKGWIYHGCEADEPKLWPEAIYVAEQGCQLSFTLESPSSLDLELRVEAQLNAVRAILDSF